MSFFCEWSIYILFRLLCAIASLSSLNRILIYNMQIYTQTNKWSFPFIFTVSSKKPSLSKQTNKIRASKMANVRHHVLSDKEENLLDILCKKLFLSSSSPPQSNHFTKQSNQHCATLFLLSDEFRTNITVPWNITAVNTTIDTQKRNKQKEKYS